MESRGRRTPRMASPTEAAPPRTAPEAEPVGLDKLVEEPTVPPEMIVERIAPPLSATVARPEPPAPAAVDLGRDIFDIVAESRAALAHGVEAISDELASFARHSIDATAHARSRC
jgi:hypothetical protein